MPVPSTISDLSTTAASNSPAGSDPIGGSLDDYLRAIQAIVRAESLNKSWEAPGHTPTWLSGTQFTVPTDLTSTYRVGRRIKATLAGPTYAYSTITASAFAAGVTTVTVVNDSTALTSPISAIEVGPDSIAMIEAGSLVASRAWATAYVAALTATDADAGISRFATAAEQAAATAALVALDPAGLKVAQIQLSAAQATTSGTAKDFTSIPAWAKRVTVALSGVSTSGSSSVMIQLGTGSGIESTSYTSQAVAIGNAGATSASTNATGFIIDSGTDLNSSRNGHIFLTKADGNSWVMSGNLSSGTSRMEISAGAKTLSGVLTQLRITTVNGTDTVDAGSAIISCE